MADYDLFPKLFNINGNLPLIVHNNSQGELADHIKNITYYLFEPNSEELLICPNDLTIITVENDIDNQVKSEKCQLWQTFLYQLEYYKIPYINGFFTDKTHPEFTLLNKIDYIVNALKQVKTEFVLFLDARDTKIRTLTNIVELFKTYNTRILFGAEKGNYGVQYNFIELHNPLHGSSFKYLNSGCFIGYTQECLDFYNEILDYKNTHNDTLDNFSEYTDTYNTYYNTENITYTGKKYNGLKLTNNNTGDQGYIRRLLNNYNVLYINVDYKSLIFLNTYQINFYVN